MRELVAQSIREKLVRAFAPTGLEIGDESTRHAGHAGARPNADGTPGETHFRIHIVSEAFAGLSRVERQRRVYSILAEEIAGGVHALSLSTLTPAEAKNQGRG